MEIVEAYQLNFSLVRFSTFPLIAAANESIRTSVKKLIAYKNEQNKRK